MKPEPIGEPSRLRRVALLFLFLNALSSILFIATVKYPVYDDPNNLPDVHRYVREGVSLETVRQHRNPTGPTSFFWMAAGIRILGGDELRDARIAALASWLILGAAILLWGAKTSSPGLWSFALLVSLVFPHALTASATVLTEGPALLFASLGSFLWLECISQPSPSPRFFSLGIVGGLSMGIAVTCRQYYLALFPAAVVFAWLEWRRNHAPKSSRWKWMALLSLLAAMLPGAFLLAAWKGLTSPAMAAGASYESWKSTIGWNFSRPIVVAFYVAIYLLPLTFPAMFRLKTSQRRVALLLAVLGGPVITYFSSLFLQPGPLNSLIQIASRLPHAGTLLFATLAAVVIYNAAAVCFLLWEQLQAISSCAPAVFASLAIVFFIAEQFGVGGNLPFYDRYILQVAPFLGLISFTALPRLTPVRLLALAGLSVLSHFMLWRFAFGG